MPVYLRALIVILVLALGVFASVKAPACALASTTRNFERRRNLWFAITLVAFLAGNFWIYIIVTATLLLFAGKLEPNKLALFFFLLLVVPPFSQDITGLGIIQHFFSINYLRLLALTILLPAFWFVRTQPDLVPFGRLLPDKLVAGYLILNFALTLTVATFTNTLRYAAFYGFIDIFLPYYVASRTVKSVEVFRDVLMAFVIAALVMGAIGVFEAVKHWLLYAGLAHAQGISWSYLSYLTREGTGLRAQGSTGQPIVLGYVMAVAFGFFFYLRKSFPNTGVWLFWLVALVAGLIAPLSRGPWVGAATMLLVFVATGPTPVRRLMQAGLLGFVGVAVLLATPLGDKLIELLPFIGTSEKGTIVYRQRLLSIGVEFILQNPFFGGYKFFLSSAASGLREGNGMVDLVNTYLAVALSTGLVGLSLFLGFFTTIAASIFKGMTNLTDRNSELHVLGQALFSTLIGVLVIIFTTSSILVIPVITWSVAGLGVAYSRILTAEGPLSVSAAMPSGLQVKSGSQSYDRIRYAEIS